MTTEILRFVIKPSVETWYFIVIYLIILYILRTLFIALELCNQLLAAQLFSLIKYMCMFT